MASTNASGVAVLSATEFAFRLKLLRAVRECIRDGHDVLPPQLKIYLQGLFDSGASDFRKLFPTHEPPASTSGGRSEVSAEVMTAITLKIVLALVSAEASKCAAVLTIIPANIQSLGKSICEYLEFSVKQLGLNAGNGDMVAEDEEVDAIFSAPSEFDSALYDASIDKDDPSACAADVKKGNSHKSLFAAYKNHPRLLSAQALLCLTRNYQATESATNSLHSRLIAVSEACILAHAKLVVSHGVLPPAVQHQVKHFPLDGNSSPVYNGTLVSNTSGGIGGSGLTRGGTTIKLQRPIFNNAIIRIAFYFKLSQNVTFLSVLALVNAVNVWGNVVDRTGNMVDSSISLMSSPKIGDQFVTWHNVIKMKIIEVASSTTGNGSLQHGRSNLSTQGGGANNISDAPANPHVIRSVDGFVSVLTLALGMLRTAQGDSDKGLDFVVDAFRGDRRERNMPEGDFTAIALGQAASGADGSIRSGSRKGKLGAGLSSLSGKGADASTSAAAVKSSQNHNLVNSDPIHFQGKVCKRLQQLCPDAVSDLMISAQVIPGIYFDLVQHLTIPDLIPALKHLADLDCTSYGHYMSTLEQATAARDDITRRRQQQQQRQQQYTPSTSLNGPPISSQPINLALVASLAYPFTCTMGHICDLLSLIFQHLPASYLRVNRNRLSRVVHHGHSTSERTSMATNHQSAFSSSSQGLYPQHQSTSTAILTAEEQNAISEEDNGVAAFIFRNMVLHLQVIFQEYKPTSGASTVSLIGLAAGGGVAGDGGVGNGGLILPSFDGMGKSRAGKALDELWESYTTKLMASYIGLLATVASLDESVAARVFVAIMGDGQVELPEIQWSSIIRQTSLAMLLPDFTSSSVNATSSSPSQGGGGRLGGGGFGGYSNELPYGRDNNNATNSGTSSTGGNVIQAVLYGESSADSRMALSRLLAQYAYGSTKSNLATQITAPYYLKCHQRLTNATLKLIAAVAYTAPRCPLEYKVSVTTLLNFFDSNHLSPEALSSVLNALGSLMCSAEEQLMIWRALRDKGLFRIGARWTAICSSNGNNNASSSSDGQSSSSLSNAISTSLPDHCLQECRVGTYDITVGLLKYLLGSIRLIAHPHHQGSQVLESTSSKKPTSSSSHTAGGGASSIHYNPFDSTAVAAAHRAEDSKAAAAKMNMISPSEALFRDPAFRDVVKFVAEDIVCSLHRRAYLRGSKEMYEMGALSFSILNEVLVATTDCGGPSSSSGSQLPKDDIVNIITESLFGGVGLNGGPSDEGSDKSFIHFMFDEDKKSAELARRAAAEKGSAFGSSSSNGGKVTSSSIEGDDTNNDALLPRQSTSAAFSTTLATSRAPNDVLNTILKLVMEAVEALGGQGPHADASTINRDEITPYRVVAIRIGLQLLVSSMSVMKANKSLAESAFTFNSRTFDSTDFVLAMVELPLIGDPVISRRAITALSLIDPRVVTRAVQVLIADPFGAKQRNIAWTLSGFLECATETTVGARRRQEYAIAMRDATRDGIVFNDEDVRRQEEQIDIEVDWEEDYLLVGVPSQLRNLGKERLFQHCTPSVANALVSLLSLNAECPAPSLTSWVCGLENPVRSSADGSLQSGHGVGAVRLYSLEAILNRVNNFYFCTQAESASLAAKYLQLLLRMFANNSVSNRCQFKALATETQNVKYLKMIQVLSSSASLLSNPQVGTTTTLRQAPTLEEDTSFLSLGKKRRGGEEETGMFKAARNALLGGDEGISAEDKISTAAAITMVYMLEFAGYAMQIAAIHVRGLSSLSSSTLHHQDNGDSAAADRGIMGMKNASVLARSDDPICEFIRKLLRVPSATELRSNDEVLQQSNNYGGDNHHGSTNNDNSAAFSDDNNASDEEDNEWVSGQAEAFAHIPGSWNSTLHNTLTSMEFGLRLWHTLSALPNFPAVHLITPRRGSSGNSSYMVVNVNNGVSQFSIPAVHQLLLRENPSISLTQLREKLRVYVYANSCLLSYASGCQFTKGWASLVEVASVVTHDHAKELAPSHIISMCTQITGALPTTTHFTIAAQAIMIDRLTNALVSLALRLSKSLEAAQPQVIRAITPAINDLVGFVVGALVRFGSISLDSRENLYNTLQIVLALPGGIVINGASLIANSDALFTMILADSADDSRQPRNMQLVALNTLRKLFTSRDLILAFSVARRQQEPNSGAMMDAVGQDGKSYLADLTLTSRKRLGLKANMLLESADIEHGGGSLTPSMILASPSADLKRFIAATLFRLSDNCIQLFSLSNRRSNDIATRALAKFVHEYAVALGDILLALSSTVPHLVYLARGSTELNSMECWASLASAIKGSVYSASNATLAGNKHMGDYLLEESKRNHSSSIGADSFMKRVDFVSLGHVATKVMIAMLSWSTVLIRDPSMQRNEGCLFDIATFVTSNSELVATCLAAGATNTSRMSTQKSVTLNDLRLAEKTSMLLLNLATSPSQNAVCKSQLEGLKVMECAVLYSSEAAMFMPSYISHDPLTDGTIYAKASPTPATAYHLSHISRINRNLATFIVNTIVTKESITLSSQDSTATDTAKADLKKSSSGGETIMRGSALFGGLRGSGSQQANPSSLLPPATAAAEATFALPKASARTEVQLKPLFDTSFFATLLTFARQMFVFSVRALAHASSYLGTMMNGQPHSLHDSANPDGKSYSSGSSTRLFFNNSTEVDTQIPSRAVLLGRRSILPDLLMELITNDERDFNVKIEQLPHICLQTLGSLVMLLHLVVVESASHIRFGMPNSLLLYNQQGALQGGAVSSNNQQEGGSANQRQCIYQSNHIRVNSHLSALSTTLSQIHNVFNQSVQYTAPTRGGPSATYGDQQQNRDAPNSRLGRDNNQNANNNNSTGDNNGGSIGNAKHATLGDFVNNCSHGGNNGGAEDASHLSRHSAAGGGGGAEKSYTQRTVVSPTTGCAAHDSRSAIMDDENEAATGENGVGTGNKGGATANTSIFSGYSISTVGVDEGASNKPTSLTHDQYKHFRRVQAMIENAHRDAEKLVAM